jgi:hypothetical protein
MTRARTTVLISLSVLLFVGACATGSSGTRRNRDVITLSEIEGQNLFNAWELVQQLRPNWLRPRGIQTFTNEVTNTNTSGYARIMVDDLPPRDLDALRDIRVVSIAEVRYINPRDATLRYGTGYSGGLIKVITKR